LLFDPFRQRCSTSTVLPTHGIVRCLLYGDHDGPHLFPIGTRASTLDAWAWDVGERPVRVKLEHIRQWAPRKIGFHATLPRHEHAEGSA